MEYRYNIPRLVIETELAQYDAFDIVLLPLDLHIWRFSQPVIRLSVCVVWLRMT